MGVRIHESISISLLSHTHTLIYVLACMLCRVTQSPFEHSPTSETRIQLAHHLATSLLHSTYSHTTLFLLHVCNHTHIYTYTYTHIHTTRAQTHTHVRTTIKFHVTRYLVLIYNHEFMDADDSCLCQIPSVPVERFYS